MKRGSNTGSWGFLTVLLVVVGVVTSVFVALVIEHSDISKARETFRASSEDIASTLSLAIQHEEDLVVSASAFVADNPGSSNQQFGRWASSVQALRRYPEITGLGHAVVVPASRLSEFAAAALRDPVGSLPGGAFRVLPPGRRAFYCFQAGSVSRDPQAAFPAGYDFCAPGSAIGPGGPLAARESGASSYVPIQVGTQTLLAVQTPVYRTGAVPATATARRKEFVGWVGLSAIPDVLLDRALATYPHTGVTFAYHVGASNAVFHTGKAPRSAQSTTISLHNGWTVRISAAGPGGILDHWNTLLMLIGGVLLSLLLGLLGRARRRRALVQTEELVLRQSEQRMNALLHNSSDMITVVSVDGIVIYQTDSARTVLGREPADLVGETLTDYVDAEELSRLLRMCEASGTAGAELDFHHGDGGSRACEVRATSLLDHPQWRGIVLNIRDVSERRRLEVELRLAQKLESVGQLAAGIAHEINTPVQFVSGSIEFLADAFADLEHLLDAYASLRDHAARAGVEPDALARVAQAENDADLAYLHERVPAALERCNDGLARVTKIVAAMRVFGHPGTNGVEPVDINAAIENTLVVAASEYKYVAEVTTDLGDVVPVLSNNGDINQVLINLIVNASHAISDVVGRTGEPGKIQIRSRVEDNQAVITIADTGTGIPADIADRVFDPFFTTKEVGRGTGQGLSIARTIINRDGGELYFDTRPGYGTTFTIRLPLVHPDETRPAATAAATSITTP